MIVEFKHAVPDFICDLAIEQFKNQEATIQNNSLFRFKEITIEDYNYSQMVFSIAENCYVEYKKLNKSFIFPHTNVYEKLRVKQYSIGDEFKWHVDVADYASAKRFLIGMIYLNDDFEGGHTEFGSDEQIHLSVVPEKGKMVFFPPFWNTPHRGCPVTNGTKYIMNVYFQYV